MENEKRDESLNAHQTTEDEVVIEVMRGDSEKAAEDKPEVNERRDHLAKALENLVSESISSRFLRFYKRYFKGKLLRTIGALVIIALIVNLCVNLVKNRDFTVTFYQVRSDKVSDNIRIAVLADLHNNEFGDENSKLVDKIKSLHPDLIVYAGDMMMYKNNDYSVLFDLSDKLCMIAPIYACYGNHELDQYLFKDRSFTKKLKQHNVTLLSNEARDVVVGRTTLQFIAISENTENFDVSTNNSKPFIENLPPTNDCRICLVHYPEMFLEKLLNRGIDVAFCGHAHGGMIRLPRIGGLYSNGEGFLPTLTSGVNEMEDGTQVVVSRGLGTSGICPRINNRPELVIVDLCWY